MTNEFHTLDGACSSLVPQGPGYENIGIENQVCTVVGSQQGQANVNGDLFVELSYGFSYSNLWRVSDECDFFMSSGFFLSSLVLMKIFLVDDRILVLL